MRTSLWGILAGLGLILGAQNAMAGRTVRDKDFEHVKVTAGSLENANATAEGADLKIKADTWKADPSKSIENKDLQLKNKTNSYYYYRTDYYYTRYYGYTYWYWQPTYFYYTYTNYYYYPYVYYWWPTTYYVYNPWPSYWVAY